jgi:hypothetical protein
MTQPCRESFQLNLECFRRLVATLPAAELERMCIREIGTNSNENIFSLFRAKTEVLDAFEFESTYWNAGTCFMLEQVPFSVRKFSIRAKNSTNVALKYVYYYISLPVFFFLQFFFSIHYGSCEYARQCCGLAG